jgi:hypothetical protein
MHPHFDGAMRRPLPWGDAEHTPKAFGPCGPRGFEDVADCAGG